MYLEMWMLFLWALSFTDINVRAALIEDTAQMDNNRDLPYRQNDKFSTAEYPYIRGGNTNNLPYPDERENLNHRCSERLERALDQIRRRQVAKQKALHLNGYSLHEPLRSAPYDMYVTDMKVRLPTSNSWVRVDRCRFDPYNHSLETSLLFNDLTISGRVNLFNEDEIQRRRELLRSGSTEVVDDGAGCSMILRLRRAGIGFHTEPIRRERGQFNVKTDSHFLEPGFISVYAYGCEPRLREHRRNGYRNDDDEGDETLSREMEDIFLKGIRSLLTTYMQKELQPAIKETLMRNMGYTISYG